MSKTNTDDGQGLPMINVGIERGVCRFGGLEGEGCPPALLHVLFINFLCILLLIESTQTNP